MIPEYHGGEPGHSYRDKNREFDSENMKENRKAGEAYLKARGKKKKKNPKGEERVNP